MRKLLIFIALFLALSVGVGASAYLYVQNYLDAPLSIVEPVALELTPGTSVNKLANDLAAKGWMRAPRIFTLYTRWRGESGRLRAGEYEIEVGSTPRTLLEQLVRGRVKLHSVTIVEGWTFKQMLAAIHQSPAVKVKLSDTDQKTLMKTLGFKEEHPEGLFFPDTYRFPKGTTDETILQQAYARMATNLTSVWEDRAGNLPLESPYEALILASIVEKETGLESERPAIAGVFTRRLIKNMRLQTDPTVIYGLGENFDGNITRRDLQRDTPYNTYTRNGLPPTPIALPGLESLQAVAQPADGTALYFVATGKGDGSHRFSDSLEEHNKAVQAYLKELRKRRSGGNQ